MPLLYIHDHLEKRVIRYRPAFERIGKETLSYAQAYILRAKSGSSFPPQLTSLQIIEVIFKIQEPKFYHWQHIY